MLKDDSRCRKAKLVVLSAMLLWTALWLTSCDESGPPPPLRITATVPPLAWLASEVAGPEVVVEHLVGPGDLPETFQPTDLQITGVARSAFFFRIGISAENGPWLRALEDSGDLEIVDLRQGLTLRAMQGNHGPGRSSDDDGARAGAGSTAQSGEGMDPHTWLSPRRLEIMAATIARHLAEIDPSRASGYAERAEALSANLRALDAELEERLAPVRGRAFFIFHPAWGYFADDYGLRQIAIEIEGKEPTEQELTDLVRQARELGMRALFVQPQVKSATPEAVARTLDARVESLDPLAFDLPANLRSAAERLLVALSPFEGGP